MLAELKEEIKDPDESSDDEFGLKNDANLDQMLSKPTAKQHHEKNQHQPSQDEDDDDDFFDTDTSKNQTAKPSQPTEAKQQLSKVQKVAKKLSSAQQEP